LGESIGSPNPFKGDIGAKKKTLFRGPRKNFKGLNKKVLNGPNFEKKLKEL